MSKCIPIQRDGKTVGLLTVVDTDFNCPKCGYPYHEADYYPQLYKSKRGLIYKTCKGCGIKIGITTDFKGDVQSWDKATELHGMR